MENRYLVSIIIPIYKVEEYIDKCLQSVIKQTYKNIEIILVDDGSPDNCGKICDEYAELDNRIKVIHKENGGLSDARNYGIEISKGDYIIFVDSDDYISHNMCECLLNYAVKYKADIVGCNFQEVYEDNTSKTNRQSIKETKKVFSGIEVIEKLFFDYSVDLNVVWNKIYAKKLFRNNKDTRFPVGILHEDDYTIYKIYYYSNNILIVDNVLYYYRRRKNSITGNFSDRNIADILKGKIEQYNFIKNKDKKIQDVIKAASIDGYIYLCKLINNNKYTSNYLIKKYRKVIIKTQSMYIMNNPYMDWKRYIKYFFIRFNLLLLVYKIKNIIRKNNV